MDTSLTLAHTHGLLALPTCDLKFCSEYCGWSSLLVSHQREAPFHAELHALDHHLIVLHLTGPVRLDGKVDASTKSKLVPPGSMGFWPAGRKFSITLRDQLDTVHLYLSDAVMRSAIEGLGLRHRGAETIRSMFAIKDDLLENLLLEAWRLAQTASDRSERYADQLAVSIAARIVWLSSGAQMAQAQEGGLTRRQLALVEDHIDRHLETGIKLQDLSALIGHSPSHFSRKFKLATDMSPHQYVMNQRVERAKRLLRNATDPIAEIAFECGFSHQEHLTHVFRKATGTTPAKYRRDSQNR